MSTAPGYRPQLLTVAEYLALGETELRYDELVDLDDPISLVACHLGGEVGYVDGGAVTGAFATTEPFPVRLDLGALG
jgi:hypothetical protein